MKRLITIPTLIILCTYLISSCTTDTICVDGEGNVSSQNRNIADFTGISNESQAIVYVTSGTEFSIVVEAEQNLLSEIKTTKSGNDLRIYSDKCLDENSNINVYITMPELNNVDLSGSGNIIVESIFSASTFRIDISGSGNISCYDSIFADNLNAEISGSGSINVFAIAPQISVDVSGSGSMVINGSGDDAEYDISGSGNIRAFSFPNTVSHIHISGSGYVEVNTSDLIEGNISGSGDIYFKNSPVIDVDITGSGHLIYVP